MFDSWKKTALSKLDKSRKGSIDSKIQKHIRLLNKHPNYYTTSTCSGRVTAIKFLGSKKHQTKYILNHHGKLSFKQISKLADQNIVLKQEYAIFHVVCKSLLDAGKLINIAKQSGFRRSGITTFSNKIVVEISSPNGISLPLDYVSEKFLKNLVTKINLNMDKNFDKLDSLYSNLKSL